MNIRALREITSELSLLYVEDDLDLRSETAKLFGHLFKSVETAENGETALQMLSDSRFDLIVTDINMPIINGLQLCKEIRQKDQHQTIIITSAHDESHYLLELIDIGIDKFITKPLDMQKLIASLSQVCTHIMNEKLVDKYKKELEKTNLELKESNEELELLVKILDKKIEQLDTVKSVSKNFLQTIVPEEALASDSTLLCKAHDMTSCAVKNHKGLYLYCAYLSPHDLQTLQSLQTDINSSATHFCPPLDIQEEDIVHLGGLFYKYGAILETYPLFKVLGAEIMHLGSTLKKASDVFVERSSDILILVESFIYVLRKWRFALFEDGVKNLNIFDSSLINDIDTIILLLQEDGTGKRNKDFF